jgi:cytidine deaminase
VAILKAVSEKKMRVKQIYVYSKEGWPPCGMCRQVMSEFADENLEVIIGNEAGVEKKIKFKDLMPLSFTPGHLIP